MRTRAYRRKQRMKHIKRKENILRSLRLDNPPHYYEDKEIYPMSLKGENVINAEGSWHPYWIVKYRAQLDKGKIHCSCGMCMSKTRNKGRRHISGNYAPSVNYKISDLKKIQQMDWDSSSWEEENLENEEDEFFEQMYGFLKDKISEERYNLLRTIT